MKPRRPLATVSSRKEPIQCWLAFITAVSVLLLTKVCRYVLGWAGNQRGREKRNVI